jgi:predicted N-acetyltransferase YhbS
MNISQSVEADCEPIATVIREASVWLENLGRPLWRSAAITAESVRNDVEAGRFIVARKNSEIVGVVRFQLQDPEYWPELTDDTSAFLHRLAVRRSVAGKGVSIVLLAAGLEKARRLLNSSGHLAQVGNQEWTMFSSSGSPSIRKSKRNERTRTDVC